MPPPAIESLTTVHGSALFFAASAIYVEHLRRSPLTDDEMKQFKSNLLAAVELHRDPMTRATQETVGQVLRVAGVIARIASLRDAGETGGRSERMRSRASLFVLRHITARALFETVGNELVEQVRASRSLFGFTKEVT